WDGSLWREVSVPTVGSYDILASVTAISSNDVWAAGDFTDAGIHPLVMHWDGSAWTQVPAPDGVPNSVNVFNGVMAISSGDIWAVGERPPQLLEAHTSVVHWDGTAWGIVRAPTPENGALGTVAGVSPSDIWAAGSYYDPAILNSRPLTMRSNGCG